MGKSEAETFTGKIVSACMCEGGVQYMNHIYCRNLAIYLNTNLKIKVSALLQH